MKSQSVARLELDGEKVDAEERLLEGTPTRACATSAGLTARSPAGRRFEGSCCGRASELVRLRPSGPVAQRLVQGTHNPLVVGSNLPGPPQPWVRSGHIGHSCNFLVAEFVDEARPTLAVHPTITAPEIRLRVVKTTRPRGLFMVDHKM